MKENAPCRYCTKRHPACHDQCEEYKAWKEAYEAQKKYLDENKYCFDIPQTASRAKARHYQSKKNIL